MIWNNSDTLLKWGSAAIEHFSAEARYAYEDTTKRDSLFGVEHNLVVYCLYFFE